MTTGRINQVTIVLDPGGRPVRSVVPVPRAREGRVVVGRSAEAPDRRAQSPRDWRGGSVREAIHVPPLRFPRNPSATGPVRP